VDNLVSLTLKTDQTPPQFGHKHPRSLFNLSVTVLISAPDDIALPRTDRLAALPLPNPSLRRALRSFWLDFFDSDALKRYRSDFLVNLCRDAKKQA